MLETRAGGVVCRMLGMVRVQVRPQSTAASALPQSKPDLKNETTNIHCLPINFSSPFSLFKQWYKDNQDQLVVPNKVMANALTFSTSNKAGRLSSRTLILRRLDEDGFVVMTDKRSRKCQDLDENPYASMVFLWLNMTDGVLLSRQVRAEGPVQQLAAEEMEELYEVEPLFCKIRAHICHQGMPVDWQQHKANHDNLLNDWQRGRHNLERPNHVVAYKLVPEGVEFYESQGMVIADRLLYQKKDSDWDVTRIAA